MERGRFLKDFYIGNVLEVRKGTVVKVLEVENEWYKIAIPGGREVCVYKGYIEPVKTYCLLQEALDKLEKLEKRDTPMKPVYDHSCSSLRCPTCNGSNLEIWDPDSGYAERRNRCFDCGQVLDWGGIK